MKYGILYNASNVNIGDDIQAYATSLFLPSKDYFIDREHIDAFKPDHGEPVAVIMNAWYMWAKWNWPPSKYIYPCMVGMHYADHQLAKQPGSPFKYEFLTGIGGDYLRAYQPIGARDHFTMEQLQQKGIQSYFSGCITMTLPKQPETPDKGTYVVVAAMADYIVEKVKKICEPHGIKVISVSHNRTRDVERSWEERERLTIERLTLYQNARCVVTKRLHCSLPCLAMEVPVFLVKDRQDDIRFSPYYDFFHRSTIKDFMNDNYEYDLINPPQNKPDYKRYRESLIKTCTEFIEHTQQIDCTADELFKPNYTPTQVMEWRHDLMKECMDTWLLRYREAQKTIDAIEKNAKITEKSYTSCKKQLKKAQTDLKKARTDLKNTQAVLMQTEKSLEQIQKDHAQADEPLADTKDSVSLLPRKLRELLKGRK